MRYCGTENITRKNGTCCKLIKLRDDWENMIRDTNYQTFSYGVDNRVEEVEGITMLSMLFCSHGGLITPIDSGQETICKYYNPNLVSLGYADGIYNYCINKNTQSEGIVSNTRSGAVVVQKWEL